MDLDKKRQRQEIEQFIDKMPVLSTTVGKVLDICSKTDASPSDLHKVISLDPVLTGQLLKLINSAYYSLVNKVTSPARAITMLGMNTVKNMALSAAIISNVNTTRNSHVLSAEKFWKHSIATAVIVQLLGEEIDDLDKVERDELFLAGFMHDLGKIPFGHEYAKVFRMAMDKQVTLLIAERELLGIDHQQVGAMIAEKWKLSPGVSHCIAHHHDFETVKQSANTRLVSIVALGNLYANLSGFGFASDVCSGQKHFSFLLERIGIADSIFDGITPRIEEEIRKAEIFLQI